MPIRGTYVWITSPKTGKDHPLLVQLVHPDGTIIAINERSGYSRRLRPGQWRTPQEQTDRIFALAENGGAE